MRKLIAGNWKMNGLAASLDELRSIAAGRPDNVDALVCVPATLLERASRIDGVMVGAQDCHAKESGAHTGDLSAAMLRDSGASHVIVGHSERRADHNEDDATVRAKTEAALTAGLVPIVCIGETEEERARGVTNDVLARQLEGSMPEAGDEIVVAYEPVWAIGTGRSATTHDVAEAHAHIRGTLGRNDVRILYGGSVKPSNAEEILALDGVDGALVGGASLKASDFLAICRAAGA